MSQPEAKVVWQEGLHFEGQTAEEFPIQLDSHPKFGGQGKGSRPAKLVLIALAGCMGMDVMSILQKKQQRVTAFEVRARADQSARHPMVYTHFWVTFVVTGHQIDPEAVARAVELSYTNYCPVANLLKPVTPIETEIEIIEAQP